MTLEQIEELAALHAVGALDGADREAFERLLSSGDERARQALREFQEAAALTGGAVVPAVQPSPDLKQKILARIQSAPPQDLRLDQTPALMPAAPGFHFVPGDASAAGWMPMKVPGAFIKLLFFNKEAGYAVVMGRLEPGAVYPPHRHTGAEELYMLSGDLHIGDRILRAGDFHHSDPGTAHGENYSEQGCTLLAVVSSQDVLLQLGVEPGR